MGLRKPPYTFTEAAKGLSPVIPGKDDRWCSSPHSRESTVLYYRYTQRIETEKASLRMPLFLPLNA